MFNNKKNVKRFVKIITAFLIFASVFAVSFTTSVKKVDATVTNNGVLFYGDATNAGVGRSQVYTSSPSWASEINGVTGSASNILWTVAKTAPTREEIMVGQLKVDGRLDIATCTTGCDANGDYTARWNNPGTTATQDCDSAPTASTCERAFDIAYMQLSGKAMVVYGDNVSDKVYYAIWDGSSWTPNSSPGSPGVSNEIGLPGTAGTPEWIRVIARGDQLGEKRTDQLMMLVGDTNADIHAFYWNGSSWDSGTTLATNLTGCTVAQCLDGGWETLNGDFIAVYATATATGRHEYAKFTAPSTWTTTAAAFTASTAGIWVGAASDPTSDRIAFYTDQTGDDTRVDVWKNDGSTASFTACSATGCPDTAIEDTVGFQIGFGWERFNSEGFMAYNDASTASSTSYSNYSSNAFAAAAGAGITTSDDNLNVKAWGAPNSGSVMLLTEDVDCDIYTRPWLSTAFGNAVADLEADTSNYGLTCPNSTTPGSTDSAGSAFSYDFAWRNYAAWQRNWRFYSGSDSATTPTTALANENTATTDFDDATTARLRVSYSERGTLSATDQRKKLQYTSGCTPNSDANACTWTDVDDPAGAGIWRYNNTTFTDGNLLGGVVLTGTSATCTAGNGCGTWVLDKDAAAAANMDHNGSTVQESEYVIQANGVAANTTYYFRIWDLGQDSPVYREQDADDCGAGSAQCTYPSLTTRAFTISGTADTSNNGATVKVAVNGTTQGQSTTISAGAWSITGVTQPAVGDIVTVWVDNVADNLESTAVTKYSAGNISGMVLNLNTLSIGSSQNTSVSVTNLGLCDQDTGCSDEDVMHTSNSGALVVDGATGYTGEVLSVLASNTLTLTSASSETISTEKINNAGTITATSTPTITLTGTSGTLFTNTGTFNQATSTVNLTGNGSATINSGSPTFYNLTSSGTGTKTLGAGINMASSGTLSVTAGTFDPSTFTIDGAGSNVLSVGASGTIAVGASTFAGNYDAQFGTITLNATSITNYNAAGTQTVSATPAYGNLTISGSGTKTLGANTTVVGTVTVTAGTLDTDNTNNYSLTTGKILINGGTLTARNSTISLTGTTGTLFTYSSGTFTAGTSTISVKNTDQLAWTQQTSSLSTGWWRGAFAEDGAKITAGNSNAASYSYTTTNYGSSWTQQTGGTSQTWSDFSASSDGTIVYAAAANAIWKSTDSGATWSNIYSLTGISNIATSGDGTKVLANTWNTSNKLFVSTNSGSSFAASGSATSIYWNNVDISRDGSTMIASNSTAGTGLIYTSTDNGANWTARNSPTNRDYKGVAVSSDGTKMIAEVFSGSIWTSSDSGANWTERTGAGTRIWFNTEMSNDGNRIIATKYGAGGSNQQGYLYTSRDNGATWTEEQALGQKCFSFVDMDGSGGRILAGVVHSNGTCSSGTEYMYLSNTPTIASGTPSFYNLTLASNAITNVLGEALTVTNDLTVTGGSLDTTSSNYAISAKTLTINGGHFTPRGSTVTLTGTGTAYSYTSGKFLAGTSTIKLTDSSSSSKTFAGGGQTYYNLWLAPGSATGQYNVTGSNTFNDFKDDGTGAHIIQFAVDSTTTVASLTLDTDSGSNITLQSANSGTGDWNIVDTSGTNTVLYVTVKDSNASGGATFDATGAGNVNGGNNTGWTFPTITISGTADDSNGATVKLAYNGTVQIQTATMGGSCPSSCTWSISGVDNPNVGDIITVWIDNVNNDKESTAVTKYSSGSVSGMVLNKGVLTIGSNQNTSISVANLALCDQDTGCSDEDIMHTSNSGALLVDAAGSYTGDTLSILSGDTLTVDSGASPSESITTEKINNAGTITAVSSPTITLSGTSGTLFTNSGTFTQATSEVVVNGAGDTTLLSAATTFHRLKINPGASYTVGGYNITMSNANAANRLYIQSGTLDDQGGTIIGTANGTLVMDSGATLKIGSSNFPSNYTNGNITLNSNSTVNYSAGTTISSTPTYGNLSITTGGTKTLGGDTTAAGTVTVTGGTLDTDNSNNRALTADKIVVNGGTLLARASNITLTSTSGTLFTNSSGTFTAGTSTVILSGNGDATINSGSPTFYNLRLTGTGVKTLGAGITLDTSGQLQLRGSGSVIFDPSSYLVTGTGSNTIGVTNNSAILRVGATTFAGNYSAGFTGTSGYYSLDYNRSGDQTLHDSCFFGGNTIYTSGSGIKTLGGNCPTDYISIGSGTTLGLSSYTLTLSGTGSSVLTNSGSFSADTGKVKFTGDGAVTVPALSYYDLNLEPTIGSGRTYTLNATTVTNDLTINPTASSSLALTVNMGGNLSVTGTTTVTGTTSGTSTLDLRPSSTDYNLTTGKINIGSAGTIDATSAASNITLNGTTGTLFTKSGTFNAGSSTVIVTSNATVNVTSSAMTMNNLTFSPTITADRVQTVTGGNLTLTGNLSVTPSAASGYRLTVSGGGNVIIASSSATLLQGSTALVTLDIGAGDFYTNTLNIATGATLSILNSLWITGSSGTLITNNGTFTSTGTTDFFSFGGGNADLTLTSGSINFYNLAISPTITTGRTHTLGTGVTVANNFTTSRSGSGTLTVNLRDMSVVGTTTVGANTTLDAVSGSNYNLTTGLLDIASGGTFLARNSTVTLTGTSGTLITETGTFTAGGSTVIMSGTSGTPTIASSTPTFNNLTISGAATKSLGEALTVGGALTISAGTLQLGAYSTTVTGTTSITGTLNDNSATGTNTFIGAVTVNSGGTWTNSNDPQFQFDAGLTVNSGSTFSSGDGLYIFETNAQTVGGTATFTINNVVNQLTSGNGLTFSGAQPSVGTLTQSNNSVLTLSGTVPTITTLDATASGNTVAYTGSTQTVKNATYHHLTISNSGIKTLGGNSTVNGNLTVGSSAVFDPTTSYSITGSGTNTINVTGTIRVQASTFAGNYASFETKTLNSGSTVDYYLNGTQTIDNTPTYYNLTLSNGGTKTLAGAASVASGGTVTVSAGTLDPLAYTIDGAGSNTLAVSAGATLDVGASTFAGNYDAQFGTVTLNATSTTNYNAAGAQTISGTPTYGHLTISGSGVKTLGGNTIIAGTATVGSGTTLDPTTSYTLTGSGTNTINVTGTIRVQASTFAGNYASFETKTLNSGSTVDYYLNGTQTIDNTLSYDNLDISTGGTKTLGGATTTTGTLTVAGGTLDTGSGSNYTLNANKFALAGGTFLPRSSTINLTGTGTVFNYGSGTYTRSGETINITDSSSSSKTLAGGGGGPWYDAAWGYRVPVTVLASEVDADLTDYPVYVDLSDLPAGFHTNVNQTDARDIRVTKSDGTTEVPREVVYYDSSTNSGELHFKASGTLSGSSDTDFYIYYGNAGASDYSPSATYGSDNVWNSAFQAVYHLPNGTTLTANDSTANSSDGTLYNTPTAVPGKIDGAVSFDNASSEHINGTGIDIASSPFTISAWIKPDSYSVDRTFFSVGSNGGNDKAIHLRQTSDTSFRFGMYSDDMDVNGLSSMANTWTQLTVTLDNSLSQKIYVNGAYVDGRTADGYFTGNTDWAMGYWPIFNAEYWDGLVDEVKVSDVDRGANWISTEYSNHNDPSAFMTVGSEESYGGGGAGGTTFNNVVLKGSGTGDFIITGDNTFNKLRVENVPHTVKFNAGSTQTVTDFDISGTYGSPVTLNSTSNGSDWNLYLKPANYGFGTYTTNYLSVRDSHVSGDSKFIAIYAEDSTNVSNNVGWTFSVRNRGGGGGGIENSASVGTCADGIQNGNETGIDTGGRCTGGGGQGNEDGTCNDGIQNGDETGTDSGGRCALGTCADGIQNGNETGIDTGGRCTGGGGQGGDGGDIGLLNGYNRKYLLASAGVTNIFALIKLFFAKI